MPNPEKDNSEMSSLRFALSKVLPIATRLWGVEATKPLPTPESCPDDHAWPIPRQSFIGGGRVRVSVSPNRFTARE
jgi:hypothetical protein